MTKSFKPWHKVLPTIIDKIPVAATVARLSGGVPLASDEALRFVMMQFQNAYIPDDHDLIEDKCRAKARMLDRAARGQRKRLEETRWFEESIRRLHASKRKAEAKSAQRVAEAAGDAAGLDTSLLDKAAVPVESLAGAVAEQMQHQGS